MSDVTGPVNGDPVGEHPSAEETAAYLSGRLMASERIAFDSHLADCRQCRQQMTFVRRTMHSARRQRTFLWIGPAASVAAAAVAAVLLLSPRNSNQLRDETVRADDSSQRIAVHGDIRVIAPRNGEAVGAAPRFVWRGSPGHSLFSITISSADGAEVWSAVTSDTSIALPPEVKLDGSRTYLWLVDAIDAEGQSVTSGTHQFTVVR